MWFQLLCHNKTQPAASDIDRVSHKLREEIDISDAPHPHVPPLPRLSLKSCDLWRETPRVKTQRRLLLCIADERKYIMAAAQSHAFITSPVLQSLLSAGERGKKTKQNSRNKIKMVGSTGPGSRAPPTSADRQIVRADQLSLRDASRLQAAAPQPSPVALVRAPRPSQAR